MAINVSFNGATIYKPGAYSKSIIDLGGGFPLSPTGLIAIFGEAEAGTPGANEVNIANNVFSPEQLPIIRAKYRSGPVVDACEFLFSPGSDGAIPSGAQAVYVYKTNASLRAQFTPVLTSWGTLRALEWGVGGNKLTFKNVLIPATSATATHAGTFDLTVSGVGTQALVVKVNGSDAYTWTSPGGAATDTVAELSTELANASNWAPSLPSGISFAVGGSNAAATLSISRSASGAPNQEGFGRNFEVVSGSLLASFPISAGLKIALSENMSQVTISNKRDLVDESATVGGNIAVKIGRNGGTTPQVTINATQILLIDSAANEAVLNKADYSTIKEIVDQINTISNWSAELGSTLFGQMAPSALDRVSALGASGSASIRPAQIKKDAFEVRDMFAQSSLVELIPSTGSYAGLPDAQAEAYLINGAKGGSLTAEITNALAKFEKIRVNSVVPLFSRDATDDISDNLTDAASTYTVDGIHQAVKTHLSLMSTTKRKSERQGYLSLKASYADCKQKAQDLAFARIQLMIQDIRQNNAAGEIMWFQPWALACLMAGARGGSPVGTPMTGKYLNCSGIRHTAQSMSTPEEDIVIDFDPDTQYDDAIQNNLTFLEAPQSGGFRVVVDNTTYGRDGNWVYNRANTMYAADVLAYDFRNQLENIYVGVKNTVKAAEVKSTCESILSTYLAQGITVSTPDAPNGFKQLIVAINGNTINISVTVKLVEGIDFILAEITLQRAQSVA